MNYDKGQVTYGIPNTTPATLCFVTTNGCFEVTKYKQQQQQKEANGSWGGVGNKQKEIAYRNNEIR